MRVIVTGGTGFLGRHVVQKLKKEWHFPIVPLRLEVDLRDERATVEWFLKFRDVDAVIHLAASVGGIGANQVNPARYCYDNLLMGTSVANAAAWCSIPRFVLAGTVCSYPATPRTIPFVEEEIWDGFPEITNAPYGIAKRAIMELLRAYGLQYGMTSVVLVPTNLYGPGDNFAPDTSHVIPAMIRKFSGARREAGASPVSLWGTGRASREFLYVEDAAWAFVRAATSTTAFARGSSTVMNLGGGGEITMADLAKMIGKEYGVDPEDVHWDHSKPDGQMRRSVNASKAELLMGWKPTVSLDDGIRATISSWEVR